MLCSFATPGRPALLRVEMEDKRVWGERMWGGCLRKLREGKLRLGCNVWVKNKKISCWRNSTLQTWDLEESSRTWPLPCGVAPRILEDAWQAGNGRTQSVVIGLEEEIYYCQVPKLCIFKLFSKNIPTNKHILIPHQKDFFFATDGDYYSNPQLFKTQRISNYSVLNSSWYICNTTPIPKAWAKSWTGQGSAKIETRHSKCLDITGEMQPWTLNNMTAWTRPA